MLKIPYVSESDVERWKNSTNKVLPVIEQFVSEGKSNNGRRYVQLFREYQVHAAILYYKKDYSGYISFLKKSVYTYWDLLKKYIHHEIDGSNISYNDYDSMIFALVVGDVELATKVAELYGIEQESGNKFFKYFGSAIKHSILGNPQESRAQIDLAQKNQLKGTEGKVRLVSAIISNNRKDIKKVWKDYLEDCEIEIQREWMHTPRAVVFNEALGFLSLDWHLNQEKYIPNFDDARFNHRCIQLKI